MLPGSDFFDDIFVPPATTAEQAPSKFRPKPRLKTLKRVPVSSNAPIPANLESPHVPGSKCPEAVSILLTHGITGSSTNIQDLHVVEEHVSQPKALDSEVLVSNADCGNSRQDADLFICTEPLDDHIEPASTTVRDVSQFQQECNSKIKELVTSHATQLMVSKEPVVHSKAPQDGAHICEGDANLQADSDKTLEEEPAIFDGMGSPDDTLFQFVDTSAGQKLSDFGPKLCPKITKSLCPSFNSDETQLTSASLEPLPCASDVKCPEQGLRLSASSAIGSSKIDICDSEFHDTEETESYREARLLIFHGDNEEASDGDQGKSGEVADMFFRMKSLDDDLQHASTSGVAESIGASNISFSSSTSMSILSELNVTQEPLITTKGLGTHADNSQAGPQVSGNDGNLQTNSHKTEATAVTVVSGVESLDDIFLQPSATAGVKQVRKFQPNLVSRPKERKTKSVSFSLPDDAETVAPSVKPSFIQMMSERFLDDCPQSPSILSGCSVDFQRDDGSLGKEDITEFPGSDTHESFLCQPTSTADQSVGKFRPKASGRTKNIEPNASIISHGATDSLSSQLDSVSTETGSLDWHEPGFAAESLVDSTLMWDGNAMAPDLVQEKENLIETSNLEAVSHGNNEGLQTIDRTLGGRDNSMGGKRRLSNISPDTVYEVQSQNVEEATQRMLDETPIFNTVEDDGSGKSSRKLRKRINVNSETGEDRDANIFQDEDISDDEYTAEEMTNKKKTPKQSKRETTENQRPVQRRKKASEDSTPQEPPKKKFPHVTRRKRRQVNKVLLDMPEDEIDPRQISIKDLIMLAEAKERISNKEAAELKNRSSTRVDKENLFGKEQDPDLEGDEASHSIHLSPTKLNYHTYMSKPKSGRWSKSDTDLFYQAVRQFGTDFAMIQQLFPNRTRHQVKLKFKNEERKHPMQVADAIVHRSKDHSHFERVIQQLQAQAEQNSKAAQAAADKYEEERAEANKEEEDAANGFAGKAQSPDKTDIYAGNVQTPSNFNEYEGVFEWDHDDSYPQDMDKDTYNEF